MDRLVRKAIEIRLHPDNFNRTMVSTWATHGDPSSKFSTLLTANQWQIQDRRRYKSNPAHRATDEAYISDHGGHIHTSYPDYDDRDGHRNVGILRTPKAADSPRRLYQVHSPRKHQGLYRLEILFVVFLQFISC
jgi:hypothetical protein